MPGKSLSPWQAPIRTLEQCINVIWSQRGQAPLLCLSPCPITPSSFYTKRHNCLEIITVILRTSNSLQHLNGKTIIGMITVQDLSSLMGCQLLDVYHGSAETAETYHLRATDCAVVSL